MFSTKEESLGSQARRLRLSTLIRLLWLAVIGQSAAIVVGAFAFGRCFGVVAASAALNLCGWATAADST